MIVKKILTILFIMIFSGCFYFTFEGIFNFFMRWWKEDNAKRLFTRVTIYSFFLGCIFATPLFLIFYLIPVFQKWYMMPFFIIISGLHLTIFEYLSGLLLNVAFKLNLWCYDTKSGKIFKGQTDLIHYLLWNMMGILIFLFFKWYNFIT